MKALVVDAMGGSGGTAATGNAGVVKLRGNYPDPIAGDGEVVLKILAAGICQTDWEIARGYMNFAGILGHEFVGTVITIGKGVDPQWIGKRVCGEINCICGKCEMCARGLSSHCFHRTVIGILGHDGAFAQLLRLPARNLHPIPDHVTNEQAVFVEPLAAAFQILRQVPIEKRTRVTILGDGRLGLLIAQVIQRTGCDLTLVGKHEEKLTIIEKLHANPVKGGKNIRTILDRDVVSKRNQDIVIDCTGRASGLERSIELVRPRGTVIMKTTVAGKQPINLSPLVIDEINVLGSRCGPFPEAIAALAAREIEVTPLISRRVTLEQAEALFAAKDAPPGIKTLINF